MKIPDPRGLYGRIHEELAAQEPAASLSATPVVELPLELRRCLHWVISEKEVALHQLAKQLRHDEAAARSLLSELTAKGLLHELIVNGELRYRPQLSPSKRMTPNLWHGVRARTRIKV